MDEDNKGLARPEGPGSCPPDQAPSGLDAPRVDPPRIMFAPMPTEEELHRVCSAKYERVRPFMIDQWPQSVAALSMPTKMVAVDPKRMIDLWDEGPIVMEVAEEIAALLDAEMGWGEYFIRLNSRSPKDAADRLITCSGKQAVSWIMSSERCLDDCSMAAHAGSPLFVCLREPRHLHPDEEFRCFAKDGKVLGLSRYFYGQEPLIQLRDPDTLLSAATAFYEANLAAHYPTVVFDLYAPGTSQELLIELNPFGLSDPCLFGDYGAVERGGVRLRDSDGSGEAGETGTGSTEGDSAGRNGIAEPQSHGD